MRLIQLGHGLWTVYAVIDDNGDCDVIDRLMALQNGNRQEEKMARKMSKILKEQVSDRPDGPNFNNTLIAKHLRDGIYQFLRGQRTGPKLRVLWFYGDRHVVVCTSCFLKRNKTPQDMIDKAIDIKIQYKKDSANGDIELIGD